MSAATPPPRPLGARLSLAWPLVVPAALLGAVPGGGEGGAIALVIVCIVCAVIGPHVRLDRASQRVLALVGAGVAFALHRAFSEAPVAGELHPAWVSTARAALAFGAFRLIVDEPDGGYVGTVVLGAVGMAAAGETHVGPGYAASVATFLAAAVWALRVADGKRAAIARVPTRARIVAVAMPLIAVTLVLAVTAPMRPISRWMQRKMERYYEERFLGGKVGFSDQMRLGRMTKLLESDEVAFRIRGPRLGRHELFRGAIFDHYDHGNWSFTKMTAPVVTTTQKGRQRGADVFEVRRAGSDSDRMFLPMGMSGFATPSGTLKVDGGGVARRASSSDSIYWFRLSDGDRDALLVQVPSEEDLALSDDAAERVAELARSWSAGAATPGEALARIETRLQQGYTHSLTSDHSKAHDPVLDFLFRNHVGHCEYFASSMALLARSLGIPARVVAGYRVTERNPYLDSYVVRERDAHGWVEAYVPGRGWQTYDPTPPSRAGIERDEGRWSAAVEVLAYAWDSAEVWLADRSMTQLIGAAVAGAALFIYLRVRKGKSEIVASDGIRYSPPLAAFERLGVALAARGHVRASTEPLETYASTLADRDVASLLERYAALRYGGTSDTTLEAELDAATQRLQRGGASARADAWPRG